MALAFPTSPGSAEPKERFSPSWYRALRFWCSRWRRTWRSGIGGNLVYPVVYLAAMGVGLGKLVDHHLGAVQHGDATLGGVSYLAFVTPAILAGSMMQIAVGEATFPVFGAIRWDYAYLCQLASPLDVADIVTGHLGFIGVRTLIAASTFVAIAAGFGAVLSPAAALAVPAGVLIALAFGAPIAAYAVTRENESSFSTIYRLGVVPLFLFSGSFFPISLLPVGLRVVAAGTPLYQGVALERSLTLGRLAPVDLVHAAYLVVLAGVGFALARLAYRRRLAR